MTLCLCWLFTRVDGARFGATDHDRDLVVDGVECLSQSGLAGATFQTGMDLAPGQAGMRGALSAEFLDDADLDAGLWDGARLDVYRVDWSSPQDRMHVWSGRLSEVIRNGDAFSAELVSLKADLERRIGRVYARDCDAQIGDSRCGVDLSDPAFRAQGQVDAVFAADRLRIEAVGAFAAGWFSGGMLSLPSGETVRVASHEGNVVSLSHGVVVEVGDAVSVTAGCDKRFATCRSKFSNSDNFRGFPHLPGMDAILSGPAGDGSDDGGRR